MHQVCLCPEHKAMRAVFDSSESRDDIKFGWRKKYLNLPRFITGKMIFDIQILILIVIQSEREQDLAFYVQVHYEVHFCFQPLQLHPLAYYLR